MEEYCRLDRVLHMTPKQRFLSQSVVGLLFFGLILFLPAGTLRFSEGWVFLA